MELAQRVFAGAVKYVPLNHAKNTPRQFCMDRRAVASDGSFARCARFARNVRTEPTVFPRARSGARNIFSRDLRSCNENNSRQFPGSLPMPSRASHGDANKAL
jgi:hypothetical protein